MSITRGGWKLAVRLLQLLLQENIFWNVGELEVMVIMMSHVVYMG